MEELKERESLVPVTTTNPEEKSDICSDLDTQNKSDIINISATMQKDDPPKEDISYYQKLTTDYEKIISTQCLELERVKQELQTTSRHFANLELAFSDVLEKYDRSKKVIGGFKNNEEALVQNLQMAQEKLKQNETKYESFKTYAKSQMDKFNLELASMKEKYEFEASKLKAVIKRLEIKCSSLETSLNQKTEECQQLSALCDDITRKQL